MQITNVRVERIFNLGEYNSLKVGFEATLAEQDKPLEVAATLSDLAFKAFNEHMGKGSAAPSHPVTSVKVEPPHPPKPLPLLLMRIKPNENKPLKQTQTSAQNATDQRNHNTNYAGAVTRRKKLNE